eukprot:PhF_6_TR27869/c0_g1_i2/m.40763
MSKKVSELFDSDEDNPAPSKPAAPKPKQTQPQTKKLPIPDSSDSDDDKKSKSKPQVSSPTEESKPLAPPKFKQAGAASPATTTAPAQEEPTPTQPAPVVPPVAVPTQNQPSAPEVKPSVPATPAETPKQTPRPESVVVTAVVESTPRSSVQIPQNTEPPRINMPEMNWRQSVQVQSIPALQPSKTPDTQAEWTAFRTLRAQIDTVYSRIGKLEEELSTSRQNYEQVIASLQGQQRDMMEKHKATVEQLQSEIDEHRNRIQGFTDLLNRKVEQVMKQEIELQQASITINEMKSIVSTQTTTMSTLQVELESVKATYRNTVLSLEYAETKVTELMSTISQLENERDNMLALLRSAHEQEIDALAIVYAKREAAAVQAHNAALAEIQRQHAEVTQSIQKQLSATYQYEIQRLRSDLEAMKGAWNKDRDEWNRQAQLDRDAYTAHARNEVIALTARIEKKEQALKEDYLAKERALDERLSRDRIERATEQQEIIITQRAREAEIRATYELQLENIDKKGQEARQAQMVEYQKELTKLAEHHRQMERDLEKLHREKEREMASRYRIAGNQMMDTTQDIQAASERQSTLDDVQAKLDKAAQLRRERADTLKKQISEGK